MGFLSEGKKKEHEFSRLLRNASFSNKEQDIHEHWDLKVDIKIDVKGLKKLKRSDLGPNENYHFLEIKNVNGQLGWMYGASDFFSFETQDYWVVVSKSDLQDLVKSKVKKDYVDSSSKALYKLYTRSGRKDVITLVKTLDLMAIATEIIKK